MTMINRLDSLSRSKGDHENPGAKFDGLVVKFTQPAAHQAESAQKAMCVICHAGIQPKVREINFRGAYRVEIVGIQGNPAEIVLAIKDAIDIVWGDDKKERPTKISFKSFITPKQT